MSWRAWLLIGAGCAACCAPLLIPLLGAAGLGGIGAALTAWAGGLGVREVICIGVIAALIVGATIWLLRRRRQTAPSCEVGGECDPRQR